MGSVEDLEISKCFEYVKTVSFDRGSLFNYEPA